MDRFCIIINIIYYINQSRSREIKSDDLCHKSGKSQPVSFFWFTDKLNGFLKMPS